MSDSPARRTPGGRRVAWLVIGCAACGAPKPPDQITAVELFEWAQTHFDGGDYAGARNGYQRFMLSDPLSNLADSAQFMLAESQLRFGQEIEAADEFSRLAIGRPNSDLADDAQLGVCRAYLQASPRVTLSQEYTNRAIVECQRLLQFFPTSDLRPAAQELLLQARGKLAEKSFVLGEYYFDRKFYESANVYFEKSLSEGPTPELMPQLLALMWESYSEIGFDSEARSVRDRLYLEFPDSEEAERVRREDGDR